MSIGMSTSPRLAQEEARQTFHHMYREDLMKSHPHLKSEWQFMATGEERTNIHQGFSLIQFK